MKTYIVEQRIKPFVNIYEVYETDSAGNKTAPYAYVQQKRLAFKERVTVYTSDQKTDIKFTIQAEKVMDIHGKFFVTAPNGESLGYLRKEFKQSLVTSTYSLFSPDDTKILTIKESSMAIAVFRRLWGFIPFIGELPFIFKYHFDFLKDNTVVGKYTKTTLLRDYYKLEIDETAAGARPELLIAQAIMLDVMQDR